MWLLSVVDRNVSLFECVGYCLVFIFLCTVNLVVGNDSEHCSVHKGIDFLLRLAFWFIHAALD